MSEQPHADPEEAIRALSDLHAPALYRWAQRRFVDRREAEEVVQETLVLAWRKYDQYDPERGSERAWLFGIVRNVAASRHRRNRAHLHLVSTTVDDEALISDDELARVIEESHIRDALDALSREHRAVIVDAYYQGHAVRDIAHRAGVPEGTVKSRLHYGLRRLRDELEQRGVL